MKKLMLVYTCDNEINQLASANKMNSMIGRAGLMQKDIAARAKLSTGYVSDLLNCRRNWSEALALRVHRAINGYRIP